MKRIFCAAVVVVVALSVPALAGIGAGNGEIGFDYGSTNYDSSTGVDSGDNFALRGGYFVNQMFEVEGQYINSDEDIAGTNAQFNMNLLMVNGVFNFHPRQDITPYVRAGLGVADLELQQSGSSVSDSGVAYQIGAGSRFFFGPSKRTAFRVDVSVVDEDVSNGTHTNFTGGFTWRLGSGH